MEADLSGFVGQRLRTEKSFDDVIAIVEMS
jgi:hypothetical protein